MQSIAAWLLKVFLDWLLGKAKVATEEAIAEKKKEVEREKTNSANAEHYEQSQTREERIDAAEDLINRDRR